MKRGIQFTMWVMAAALYAACSDVKFNSVPIGTCKDFITTHGSDACVLNPDGTQSFRYSEAWGEVDILIVNDNSGSMYVEQEKMATQFPGFLDQIHKLSYQIGMITTDVSGSGPLQDGRLLEFAPGVTFLKNSSREKDATHFDNITKFQKTIKRGETLNCHEGSTCPSGDERGIYALNRALERSENANFFRSGGHLAVVILSDEDVRSTGGGLPGSEVNGGPVSPDYLAEPLDKPETFVQKTKEKFGSMKGISVHSIVIPPAPHPQSASCHQAQNSQGADIRGHYGVQYARLSRADGDLKSLGHLIPGDIGSICSPNYTKEMGDIATKLNRYAGQERQLPCAIDTSASKITFTPEPSTPIVYELLPDNRIRFSPTVPPGTWINFNLKCLI